MNAPRSRSIFSRWLMRGALLMLLFLLLPWAPLGAAPQRTGPAQLPHFSGTVTYEPEIGSPGPQAGVEVTLYGIPAGGGGPVVEYRTTSAADGSYDLYARSAGYESFAIVKEEPRGLVPGGATAGQGGTVMDASMILYPASVVGEVCCGDFTLHDPYTRVPLYRDRYLIVTTAAIVPALDDFIAFKEFTGLDVQTITVEELDPDGLGGNYLRNQIRDYERGLWDGPGGLKYVLLIGTDRTVPFLKLAPTGDDPYRLLPDWPPVCASLPQEPNSCGWPTDWFYVDLTSDWNSNGDDIIGEDFYGKTPRDDPPAFNVDVALGRLPFDSAWDVQAVLDTIIKSERDGGAWKTNALLAGGMMDYGEEVWDPESDPAGSYKHNAGPTDAGYLMEEVWADILEPEGFTPVRLYEKRCPPTGYPPSSLSPDAPLSDVEFVQRWQAADYGLVKVGGHGSSGGVVSVVWTNDWVEPGSVQNPTEPLPPDNLSKYELDAWSYLSAFDTGLLQSPSQKAPILMAMACDTGQWLFYPNMASDLLSAGNISAWTGGTGTVAYSPGWRFPGDGAAQTIDYNITRGLISDGLTLGDAVWNGLAEFHAVHGAHWGNDKWDWGFIDWNLYGDPSMTYWGQGPDWRSPWPMFHYDWQGRGQTALNGPSWLAAAHWSKSVGATPSGGRTPSPVIGRDDRIVVGDGEGVVHAFSGTGTELWTYDTGAPIDSAAALGMDGTAYVHSTNGVLYAIAADGSLRWSRTVGESDASLTLAGSGVLYLGGSDHNGPGGSTRYLVLAYRSNGVRVASREVAGRITTTPSIGPRGRVWVGTANGFLYELSADLDTVYTHSISPGLPIGDGVTIADDAGETVLVPAGNGLVAWSGASDSIRWTFATSDTVRSAPALTQDGKVLFGSQDGYIYALSLDGNVLWTYDTGGPVDSSPALSPVNLYVVGGTPAKLFILRAADGAVFSGQVEIGGSSLGGSSPAIGDGGLVYAVSSEGALVAVGKAQLPRMPLLSTRVWPWEIYVRVDPGDLLAEHLIERRLPGEQWGVVATLGAGTTEFHDDRITPGAAYQYRAAAIVGAPEAAVISLSATRQVTGTSEYSPIVQARALRGVPATPGAPTVTALSSSELHLTWTLTDTAPVSLRLWRQDPGEPDFHELVLIPGGSTEYVDQDLFPGSVYSYTLQAIDDGQESAQGPGAQGQTWARTLPAPSHVAVEPLDDTTFRVCWVPGDAGLDSVVARLPAGAVQPEELGRVLAGQDCFTDTNAYPYTFKYWVKHVQGEDESAWAQSAPASAPGVTQSYHIFLPFVQR